MLRTYKTILYPNKNISSYDYNELLHQMNQAKILYNQLLFIARQTYFSRINKPNIDDSYLDTFNIRNWDDILDSQGKTTKQKISNPFTFIYLMKKLKSSGNFIDFSLNSKVIQAVCKKVSTDWKSFEQLKHYAKSNNINGLAKIPKYKTTYCMTEYNKGNINKKALRNQLLILSGMKNGVKIPNFIHSENIQSARVLFKNDQLILEIMYNVEENRPAKNTGIVAGIDVGLDTLFAITFNKIGLNPILIKNKKMKADNQLYNKKLAKYRSLLSVDQKSSKRIKRIVAKRNNQMDYGRHMTTKRTVEMLLKANVEKVIIGWNKNIKSNIKLGKRTNQNFTQIPFAKIIETLKYKLEAEGIVVKIVEESYTSKSSVLSGDILPEYKKEANNSFNFSGKRLKRGLYEDKNYGKIQADINGSYNILRKSGLETEEIVRIARENKKQGLGIKVN